MGLEQPRLGGNRHVLESGCPSSDRVTDRPCRPPAEAAPESLRGQVFISGVLERDESPSFTEARGETFILTIPPGSSGGRTAERSLGGAPRLGLLRDAWPISPTQEGSRRTARVILRSAAHIRAPGDLPGSSASIHQIESLIGRVVHPQKRGAKRRS